MWIFTFMLRKDNFFQKGDFFMAIKYKWLAGTLRALIKKDVKNEINKLPSEQELCRRYHVSRQTVRQALNLLTQEGLIEKRHGSGSYITGHSSNLSDDIFHHRFILRKMKLMKNARF